MILVFLGVGMVFLGGAFGMYGCFLIYKRHKHTRTILKDQKRWSKSVDRVVSDILS